MLLHEPAKKLDGCSFVPLRVEQYVQHLAFGINDTPKIYLCAADFHEDFVQVPL